MINEHEEHNPEIEPEQSASFPPELRDIIRLIETRTTAPTDVPKNVYQQIRIVVSGANATLYIYDATNNYWRGATLGT